jgi:hypothetical protein
MRLLLGWHQRRVLRNDPGGAQAASGQRFRSPHGMPALACGVACEPGAPLIIFAVPSRFGIAAGVTVGAVAAVRPLGSKARFLLQQLRMRKNQLAPGASSAASAASTTRSSPSKSEMLGNSAFKAS